jgi:hypothetical protein
MECFINAYGCQCFFDNIENLKSFKIRCFSDISTNTLNVGDDNRCA